MSGDPGEGGRTARTTAAGVIVLLGFFAIPCSVFAAVATYADWRHGSPNVGTDLQVLAIFACAAAALIPLGRFLVTRERRAPHEAPSRPDPSAPGRSLGAGFLCAAIGLAIIGAGAWRAATVTHAFTSEDFLFAPAGGIFLFAGIQLALPLASVFLRHLFGALLMTSFAMTFDWIAFGPGERHFSGGLSVGVGAIGLHPGEWLGRAMFGIPAVITTVVAAIMWVRWR